MNCFNCFFSTIGALTPSEAAQCMSPSANPCLNGGSCFSSAAGVYVCACVDGKAGARCEEGKVIFEIELRSLSGNFNVQIWS